MNKEHKRARSDVLENNAVDLRSGIYDFTAQLRVLNQMRGFVVPVTRQLIGVLIERGNKQTPLTNYVRNIMFGSYHAQNKSEFIKALQSAVDLTSIYLIEQRLSERDSVVRAVNNVVDYLGCLYLLKTEGLDREVPHQVQGAIEFLNNTAVAMSNLIKNFQARYFPNQQSGGGSSSSIPVDNYYSSTANTNQDRVYFDTAVKPSSQTDYRTVGEDAGFLPPYQSTPRQPSVEQVQTESVDYMFYPVKYDNANFVFDSVTSRPVYELNNDRNFYYVHKNGDWWIILDRQLKHVGVAEFVNCGIKLLGQPEPKEGGYEDKPLWDADKVFNHSKSAATKINPTGSSILEEVTFSPDSDEVEVKRSVNLSSEESIFSSYAEEEVIMADFVAEQNIGTEKVEEPSVSKYRTPSKLSDGSTVVLATPENISQAIETMKKQDPLMYIPAFYPDKEMLFIVTDKDGKVDLILHDDEEVLMSTKLERMILASGLSRTPHTQEAALQRQGSEKDESFFSGMEINLSTDHANLAEERKVIDALESEEDRDNFAHNETLSFNYIIEAPNVFSACVKARIDANKNSQIPFRYHHPTSFIADETHPAEMADEDGNRKILTALEKCDTTALVEFLFNEYNLGTRGERMTPLAWYINDTIINTINSFIEQEMGLVRFCVIDNLRNDYYQMLQYVRNKKGEVVAKALSSRTFHERIRGAIGGVDITELTIQETSEKQTMLDFVKIDFVLYWPIESHQISFLLMDQTVLISETNTPSLYKVCWRMLEMANELMSRDSLVTNNVCFVTKDHRLLRVVKSPYSSDILLTAVKAN